MKQQTETQTKMQEKIAACPKEMQAKFDAKQIGQRVARHGDLELIKAKLPSDAKPVEGQVLLKSDATGHIHGVKGAVRILVGQSMHKDWGQVKYLVVEGPAMMAMHLEHRNGPLPIGCLEVRPQREGRSDVFRQVLD